MYPQQGYGESAHDYLFTGFGDCNALANTASIYYDIAGYNTRQRYNNAHAWCGIEVNDTWYEIHLQNTVKEYDRNTVRNMIRLLNGIGLNIYRG